MKTEIVTATGREIAQALGESEQRYQRLLSAVTDYIYSVNLVNGRPNTTSHGPGCEAVTGYTSAEFAADPYLWYRVIHEEDRVLVLAQVEKILAGETPQPLEHRLLHKQGGVRWISNTTIPHRDNRGRLISYDGLISDITGRKRAELFVATEHAVLASLAPAPTVTAALPAILQSIGINLTWDLVLCWLVDVKSKKLAYKVGWQRLAASTTGTVLTTQPSSSNSSAVLRVRVITEGDAVWISDRAAVSDAGNSVLPDTMVGGAVVPLCDGRQVLGVLEVWSREALPPDEEMLRELSSIGAQIGQFIGRKIVEHDRDEEQRLLRTVVDNLPDSIFVKDAESRFALVNAAHLRLLGVADGREVCGKTDFDFFPKELAMLYHDDDQNVCRSAQPLLNREEQVVDRGGNQRWYLTTKVPLKDTEGNTTGLVGIGRDILDLSAAAERLARVYSRLARKGDILKRMVQELKSSKKQLEATQMQLIQAAKLESVGTLAAGVAHEVKNPLQTILLGLRYVSRSLVSTDENIVQTLADMREAIKRADAIIRELLALSAVSEFHREPGSLNAVIEGALMLMRNQFVAAKVNVKCELCPSLPLVMMDHGKLQQIFLNFFLNAVQAMPEGGTLCVTTSSTQKNGHHQQYASLFQRFQCGDRLVVAEVQDTGRGIADADLPRVFDPFFTTKAVGEGTGLGLTVAQKIVELHGGAVTIGNAAPRGAHVAVAFKAEG